jgi:hypothetical protein
MVRSKRRNEFSVHSVSESLVLVVALIWKWIFAGLTQFYIRSLFSGIEARKFGFEYALLKEDSF